MNKLVVANWKMNGSLVSIRDYAYALIQKLQEKPIRNVECAIAPPFPYLMFMDGRLSSSGIKLAGQDCSPHGEKGAYTGDISASMLKDIGCHYVIIGHSERRHIHKEDDTVIAQKVQCAIHANIIPILCVGETLTQKDEEVTEEIVLAQLEKALPQSHRPSMCVVAYEPVWSIGTGRIPTSQDISSVCALIHTYSQKNGIDARVLYGGSVNNNNAAEILSLRDVDGVLVGGASLTLDTFWPILESAQSVTTNGDINEK